MGCLCIRKLEQRRKHYQQQVIRVKSVQSIKDIKFTITTHPITHMQADLLMFFTDSNDHLKNHDFLIDFPNEARKIQQHLEAHQQLQKQKMKDQNVSGQYQQPCFMTVNLRVSHLKYKKVGVLQCQPWKHNTPNDLYLKTILRSYFQSIQIHRCQSIVITQFPSFLGVHLQEGVKRLMREIVLMKKKPCDISFCCLNGESMAVYIQQLKYDYKELQKSSEKVEDKDDDEGSLYF